MLKLILGGLALVLLVASAVLWMLRPGRGRGLSDIDTGLGAPDPHILRAGSHGDDEHHRI